jgi:hypothetical protein
MDLKQRIMGVLDLQKVLAPSGSGTTTLLENQELLVMLYSTVDTGTVHYCRIFCHVKI